MEGLVTSTKYQNWHTSHRELLPPLALFPTPQPIFPSPSIALESSWEDNGLVVFLSREEDQSNSSPPQIKEMPMVLDLFSSTSSFATPVQLPPVNPLPDGRHCLSLFVSGVFSLSSFASPISFFVISPSLLAFSVPPPVSFSQSLSPLFLLSASPVVAPFPSRALPLLLFFVLQASACTFHYQNLTSKQS